MLNDEIRRATRLYIAARNLSQSEAAASFGIHRTHLNRYLHGAGIDGATLDRIVAVLRVENFLTVAVCDTEEG